MTLLQVDCEVHNGCMVESTSVLRGWCSNRGGEVRVRVTIKGASRGRSRVRVRVRVPVGIRIIGVSTRVGRLPQCRWRR